MVLLFSSLYDRDHIFYIAVCNFFPELALIKAELMVYTHAVFQKKHFVQNDNVYHWLFITVSWYVFIFLN